MTQGTSSVAWEVDYGRSSIHFTSQHAVIAPVSGTFQKFQVLALVNEEIPQDSSVQVWIEVASLDTGNPQRDAHLRSPDFLYAAKYPWITFVSRSAVVKDEQHFSCRGDLCVRGVTRPVVLEGRVIRADAQGADIEAHTSADRRDFGLRWNAPLLGWLPLVGDAISIRVNLGLNAPAAKAQHPRAA